MKFCNKTSAVLATTNSGRDTWIVAQYTGAHREFAANCHLSALNKNNTDYDCMRSPAHGTPTYKVVELTGWSNRDALPVGSAEFYDAAAEAAWELYKSDPAYTSKHALEPPLQSGVNPVTGDEAFHYDLLEPITHRDVQKYANPCFADWRAHANDFVKDLDQYVYPQLGLSLYFSDTSSDYKTFLGSTLLAHCAGTGATWNVLSFIGADSPRACASYGLQSQFAALIAQVYYIFGKKESPTTLSDEWLWEKTQHLYRWDPRRLLHAETGSSITYTTMMSVVAQVGPMEDGVPRTQADVEEIHKIVQKIPTIFAALSVYKLTKSGQH